MSKNLFVWVILSFGTQLYAQDTALDSAKYWTRLANRVIANNPDSAVVLLQHAAEVYLHAGEDEALCRVYNGLAASHSRRYDFEAAESYAKRGLAHSGKTIGTKHPIYINTLSNLGKIYRQKGALMQAKKCYEEALEIALSTDPIDYVSLSRLYNNFGICYRRMGDPQAALQYFQTASRHLATSERASKKQLFSLGLASSRAYDDLGQIAQAKLTLYESRPLLGEEANKKSVRNWIQYAHRLASLHYQNQAYDSVAFYLDQADQLRQSFGPYREQVSLEIRANLARQKEDWHLAEEYIRKSMDLRSKEFAGMSKSPALAQSYQQLGDLFRQTQAWEKASEAYMEAFYLLSEAPKDSLPRLSEVLQLRELIVALQAYINCQAKLYAQNTQIAHWQKGISASLLADSCISQLRHSYQEDQAKYRLGELGHEIYELGIALAFARYQNDPQTRWLELGLRFAEGSKAMVLFESQQQLEALHNAGLPDSLKEQENFLKAEIAFYKNLILSRTKADSVSKNRWQQLLFERQQTEQAFRQRLETDYPLYYQMCYAEVPIYSISKLQQRLDPQKLVLSYFWGDDFVYAWAISSAEAHFLQIERADSLASSIAQFRSSLQQVDFSTAYFQQYTQQAHALWADLTANLTVASYQSLEIIPDGPLANIPWEALLYEPYADTVSSLDIARLYRTLPYCFQSWAISYGFSLRLQLEKLSSRPSDGYFAAFAPQYPDSLALTYNQESAQKLQQQFQGTLFQGAAATESNFKSVGDQYSVLHLGMHGRIDPLDGQKTHLQFSAEDSLQDAYLHLFELYDLSLSAQLVVLAACESAGGAWIEGEGVMSLSRAFRYAGCPSLVASLWEADGRVASQLLESFYQELELGKKKDQALQSARKNFLTTCSPDLTHPSYWSTFVITGDSSPLQKPSASWWKIFILISSFSIICAIAYKKFKKRSD